MQRFMLVDEPWINDDVPEEACKQWRVVRVYPQPSVVVALFIGGNPDDKYMDEELAPLLAGDYVEFLNEKYLDKNINEEWPPKENYKTRFDYHLKKAGEYGEKLNKESRCP